MKDTPLVKRAWREVGYGMPEDLDSKEKLEDKIQEIKKTKISFADHIAELQDRIAALEDQIENITNYESMLHGVLHQIKVERYKELNKDKDIEIY